ncbi:porin [Fulvimonas sp. R45]|uniref:OprO/OprP family phosphate-selective porin n=1 Tax=Fulvimonas sp. R45 TaxID=3045937 RepID=UPI00265DA7F1|nr:porin [Fulvimonas sp. R45]MDO1529322.1 porin [Fulvimonas sp. R45]
MRSVRALPVFLLGLASAAAAGPSDPSLSGDWPTHARLDDGTDFGASALWQYDLDRFSNDGGRLADARTNRRKYLGLYVKKKGVYDAKAEFDFQSRKWQDAYLRLQSEALFGGDAGALRIGQGKTPVGFEGNTGSNATTFIELALPSQAVYENRRIGVDWSLQRPSWLVSLGYYGGDLQGDNDGRTLAARVAWVPVHREGKVLHLGLAASRERPQASVDGRGVASPPAARLRSTPEAGLAPVLLDTGTLAGVERLDRTGLEGLWIEGPWSVQGEYLHARTVFRRGDRPDFDGRGWYVSVSWVPTGESRPYQGGNVGNIVPSRPWGAVELAVRYSELDLDDAPVAGGRGHDWTLGVNGYLGRHLRLQANYIRAFSDRRGRVLNPHIIELRAVVAF